jgi:type VI secretion system secreted protein VgrG
VGRGPDGRTADALPRAARASNAQGIAVGRLLKLSHHPRKDQNDEFLVTSLSVRAQVNGYESGNAGGRTTAASSGASRRRQQFRPAAHAQALRAGPQTATVVGPVRRGDLHRQVRPREDAVPLGPLRQEERESSCWVRVAHPWAGKNFGIVDIPRIGQEVVVDFLEGDPDQPLITGRVYNAEQMPPWDLPANATQSGHPEPLVEGRRLRQRQRHPLRGQGGSEQVWIHAEKNQDIEVEKDETHWVGNDRKKTIDHDETTLVKHDRTRR